MKLNRVHSLENDIENYKKSVKKNQQCWTGLKVS